MPPSIFHDILDLIGRMIVALMPAALGALVAQIHERGLAWRDRLLAMIAGICVSYYVTLGASVWFGLDPFIAQAVGFVLAMIAHKATPRVIDGLASIAADLPALLRDRFLPRKEKP